MKRNNFIKALVAAAALPVLSFKKDEDFHSFLLKKGFTLEVSPINCKKYIRYTGKFTPIYDYGITIVTDNKFIIGFGVGLYYTPKFIGKVTTVNELEMLFKMLEIDELS